MQIPDCYEAYREEEARQAEWDNYMNKLPVCAICGERIQNGQDVHWSGGKSVCGFCLDDLNENVEIVEVE